FRVSSPSSSSSTIAGSTSSHSSLFNCRAGRCRIRSMSVSILVVDDEPDVAELFRQRFRRETRQGTYVMHFAGSGAEALDRLQGEIEPTLVAVLSDINMPGMDGLELLTHIKRRFPDLPVMMVTAYGDDERRRRAAEFSLAWRRAGAKHMKAAL